MASKLITCPETAHLEAIDCVVAPDGELLTVRRCTRFEPNDDVRCELVCIARLNRRRSRG